MASSSTTLPHSRCNWLIPDLLLIGAVPTRETLPNLLEAGIQVFICLSGEEDTWYQSKLPKGVRFYHCPIPSGGVPADTEDLLELVDRGIIARFKRKRKIYLHCSGGHGRTGLVGALVLGRHYGYKAGKAIRKVERSKDTRLDTSRNFIPTPETTRQVRFVAKFLGVETGETLPDRTDMSWLKRVREERRKRRMG